MSSLSRKRTLRPGKEKDMVECHLCHKTMRFYDLKTRHLPDVHHTQYRPPPLPSTQPTIVSLFGRPRTNQHAVAGNSNTEQQSEEPEIAEPESDQPVPSSDGENNTEQPSEEAEFDQPGPSTQEHPNTATNPNQQTPQIQIPDLSDDTTTFEVPDIETAYDQPAPFNSELTISQRLNNLERKTDSMAENNNRILAAILSLQQSAANSTNTQIPTSSTSSVIIGTTPTSTSSLSMTLTEQQNMVLTNLSVS